MDPRTFDHLTASVAHQRSRRVTLRVLAGGLLGGFFVQRGTTPTWAAAQADGDSDGLYDDDEANVYGTDPFTFDTDGDGMGDGEEIYLGTDPLTAGGSPARIDSDGDGLYDDDEGAIYGTSSTVYDTDGDGVSDGEEVNLGTDPLTPAGGAAPPAAAPVPGVCRDHRDCGSDAYGQCFCDLHAITGAQVCNKAGEAVGPFTSCAQCPAGTNCFNDELYGFYCFPPCGS